jgi:hypothetical protein
VKKTNLAISTLCPAFLIARCCFNGCAHVVYLCP